MAQDWPESERLTSKHDTMKSLLLLLFIALTSSAIAQDALPDIQVQRLDGSKVSILDVVKTNGKKITVINFWATWCKPCRNELENIAYLYGDWVKSYDMELIAVSIDDSKTQAQIQPYINAQGFEYRILVDGNKNFFQAVNGITPPLTLVVNDKGEILKVEHGYIEGNEYELEEFLSELSE